MRRDVRAVGMIALLVAVLLAGCTEEVVNSLGSDGVSDFSTDAQDDCSSAGGTCMGSSECSQFGGSVIAGKGCGGGTVCCDT